MSRTVRIVAGIVLLGFVSWPVAHAIGTSVMSPEEVSARGPFWQWFLFFFVWIASIPTFFMVLMMVRQGHAEDAKREHGMPVEDRVGHQRS